MQVSERFHQIRLCRCWMNCSEYCFPTANQETDFAGSHTITLMQGFCVRVDWDKLRKICSANIDYKFQMRLLFFFCIFNPVLFFPWQSDQIMRRMRIIFSLLVKLEMEGQVKSSALWDTVLHTVSSLVYCTVWQICHVFNAYRLFAHNIHTAYRRNGVSGLIFGIFM